MCAPVTHCFHDNLYLQLVTLKESLLKEVKSHQAVLDFDSLRVGGQGTGNRHAHSGHIT